MPRPCDRDLSLRAVLTERNSLFVILFALLLALTVRVGFVLATHEYVPRSDPLDYQRIAESVASGHGFGPTVIAPGGGPSAFRPPLYPVSLGVFYRVFGVHIVLARLAQALIGTGAVALIGVLALRLSGKRIGAIALLLAAVYPPLVFNGGALVSESLAIPLEVAAVLAALSARRSSRPMRWLVLTGALAALGILNRPNSALLLVPFIILACGASVGGWAAIRRAGLIAGSAGLVLVPWLARDYHVFDEFVPLTTQSGLVMAGTYNATSADDDAYPAGWRPANLVPEYAEILAAHPEMNEVEMEQRFRAEAMSYLRAHPAYTFKVAFWNTLRVFDLSDREISKLGVLNIGYSSRVADVWLYSYYVVAAFALVGIGFARRSTEPPAVWLVPIFLVVSIVFLQGFTRLRAGVEPFVVLLAALAIERLVSLVRSDRRTSQDAGMRDAVVAQPGSAQ